MHKKFGGRTAIAAIAMLACAVPGAAAAQDQAAADADNSVTVNGRWVEEAPIAMTEGPDVKGFISARNQDQIQITTEDGRTAVVAVTDETRISGAGGFLGMGRSKAGQSALLNGLPVTIKTMQAGSELVASQIKFQSKDLKTASMIRNGTDQRFAEQTAATEALRGRVGDIDKYNVKHTTNVHFDTGKHMLSPQDKLALCEAARTAEGMDNALLLVVGYTDSVGDEDFNQTLSEKRATRVVNYLQQACSWKPYRMLTPTGMAMADPAADNSTEEGRAQNRRVAVNVLVSKAVDGI